MYKLVNDTLTGELKGVCIPAKNMNIPLDPANTDYQKYLAWLAEGNEPLPADN